MQLGHSGSAATSATWCSVLDSESRKGRVRFLVPRGQDFMRKRRLSIWGRKSERKGLVSGVAGQLSCDALALLPRAAAHQLSSSSWSVTSLLIFYPLSLARLEHSAKAPQLGSSDLFISLKCVHLAVYWKGRAAKQGAEADFFHLHGHSSNGHDSWVWARPEPGAWNSTGSSLARAQLPGQSSDVFPGMSAGSWIRNGVTDASTMV